ncbi:MAG: cation transporting ATPase C-terminal domain-containing protein, partial [Nanoarchaeota archaeon]
NMKGSIILTGIIGTILTLGIFSYIYFDGKDMNEARTVALTSLIVFELFRAYSVRSNKAFSKTIFSNKWLNLACLFSLLLQLLILYTPKLNVAFKTVPLYLNDWIMVFGIALTGYLITELYKLFRYKEETKTENI